MMKNVRVIILILLVISVMSCMGKDPCVTKENLAEVMTEITDRAKEYSVSKSEVNWSSLDARFDKCVQQCYVSLKEEMNAEERIEFYKKVIKYSKERDTRRYEVENILEDAGIRIEDEIAELGERGSEELERFFRQELLPELENVLEDVLKEIENFGQELKEQLQEMSRDN